MNKDKVCVITVTYGKRKHLLEQVVRRVQEEGIKNIVVVDNDSEDDISFDSPDVYVIHSDVNVGSAGGFKLGIETAQKIKTDCDHYLLLDDDNLVGRGVVDNLVEYRGDDILSIHFPNDVVLFCFRHYDEPFLKKTEKELFLPNLEKDTLNLNSFCYFSFDKMFTMMKNLFKKRVNNDMFHFGYEIVANGYGGMFLHKSVVEKAGLPDTRFFLYWSDVEWTYRMFKKGCVLFLLPHCRIDDLEQSLAKGRVQTYFKVGDILQNIHDSSDLKLRCEYKERVMFEQQLITNKFKYDLNKIVFFWFIFPLVKIVYRIKFKNTTKLNLMYQAIKDGMIE